MDNESTNSNNNNDENISKRLRPRNKTQKDVHTFSEADQSCKKKRKKANSPTSDDLVSTAVTATNPDEHGMYQCKMCHKKFTTEARLKIHCRKDTCRVHSCHLCSERFLKMRELKSHVTLAHGDETIFQCGLCSRNFKLKSLFVSHSRIVHPDLGPILYL